MTLRDGGANFGLQAAIDDMQQPFARRVQSLPQGTEKTPLWHEARCYLASASREVSIDSGFDFSWFVDRLVPVGATGAVHWVTAILIS